MNEIFFVLFESEEEVVVRILQINWVTYLVCELRFICMYNHVNWTFIHVFVVGTISNNKNIRRSQPKTNNKKVLHQGIEQHVHFFLYVPKYITWLDLICITITNKYYKYYWNCWRNNKKKFSYFLINTFPVIIAQLPRMT